jgi:hypothetical protein
MEISGKVSCTLDMREMGGDNVIKFCCRDLAFKVPLYIHFCEQDAIRG